MSDTKTNSEAPKAAEKIASPVKAEVKAEQAAPAKAPAAAAEKKAEAVSTPAPAAAKAAAVAKAAPVAKAQAKPAKAKARKAKTAVKRKAKPTAATVRAKAVSSVSAGIKKTSDNIQKGTAKMTNQTQKNFDAGKVAADRVQSAFGDVNERAKTVVAKSSKMVEEMTELTKGNVEAIVASSKVAAKGIETLGQEAADYSRRSFEGASAALKSFAEVKSPTDFFKLQSDYVRSAFDSWVSESSKTSEAVLKLAGEVAEPITSRYAVAADRVKNVAAL